MRSNWKRHNIRLNMALTRYEHRQGRIVEGNYTITEIEWEISGDPGLDGPTIRTMDEIGEPPLGPVGTA